MKPKDLIGIPWLAAFALRADGWYLRRDIIWQKPNPMPESVTDRPTSAHEYLFLLAKSATYYYDADAIAEPLLSGDTRPPHGAGQGTMPGQRAANGTRRKSGNTARKHGDAVDRPGSHLGRSIPWEDATGTRNARSVWTIATRPYSGGHFATMPAELARRCIMAGSAPGDTVLDPFGGSGTTAATAVGCGRNAMHIELNPAYQALARERIGPMFCRGAA
jgi:DNA modification methylase